MDFDKVDGLVPAVIQDAADGTVLMVGYMNKEALEVTRETGRVTFFSRSRQRLWTKGETSGNWLEVKEISADCDADALLVLARQHGPTCHTGARTCFPEQYSFKQRLAFLEVLGGVIRERGVQGDVSGSYTAELIHAGPGRIAQKVGEEAVELVLEAASGSAERLVSEAADLLYHVMVLLEARGCGLVDVVQELQSRHGG